MSHNRKDISFRFGHNAQPLYKPPSVPTTARRFGNQVSFNRFIFGDVEGVYPLCDLIIDAIHTLNANVENNIIKNTTNPNVIIRTCP